MKRMITTIFFAAVTFPKRAPRIIIILARNAENGGVLMSITLPNLNHSFIFPVPVPDFRVFHTPHYEKTLKSSGKCFIYGKLLRHTNKVSLRFLLCDTLHEAFFTGYQEGNIVNNHS